MKSTLAALYSLGVLAALTCTLAAIGHARGRAAKGETRLAEVSRHFTSFEYEGGVDSDSQRAKGFGVVKWFDEKGVLAFSYSGQFEKGEMDGPGRGDFIRGGCAFEGTWEHGVPIDGELFPAVHDTRAPSPADTSTKSLPRPDAPAAADSLADPTRHPIAGIKLPTVKSLARPRYPRYGQIEGFSGTVRGNVLVGKDGRVKKVKIEEAPHPCFLISYIEATYETKFEPARWKGKPVAVWVLFPVRYTLDP